MEVSLHERFVCRFLARLGRLWLLVWLRIPVECLRDRGPSAPARPVLRGRWGSWAAKDSEDWRLKMLIEQAVMGPKR